MGVGKGRERWWEAPWKLKVVEKVGGGGLAQFVIHSPFLLKI